MTFIKKLILPTLLLSSCFSNQLVAEDKLSFVSTELAEGLYMLEGAGGFTGGNIGLSVGEDGVIMIDDAMPSSLDILQQAIKDITDKPINFLLNTHVHADHTGNNAIMAESGAHIISHENLREYMKNIGIPSLNGIIPATKSSLPVITFSDSITFHLNNEDAFIFHTPSAHTNGDAVIVFKQANVIHTGDVMFNGLFPYIDLANGGSVEGYIAAQERIYQLANNATKIIPGHGPLASKKDLKASITMLKEAKHLISHLIEDGKSQDEVVKINPLKKYHKDWNWGFITTEKMTIQMFQGLSKNVKPHQHQHKH